MKFSRFALWLRYPFSTAWRFLEADGRYVLKGHVFVLGYWAFAVMWRVSKSTDEAAPDCRLSP